MINNSYRLLHEKHENLAKFSKRLRNQHHLQYVKLRQFVSRSRPVSSNSVHAVVLGRLSSGLRGILSGTGGKWGLWVSSSSSSSLPGPQANPEAFLAWTHEVKSPVIKQLGALLWGDLVQCGKCQSDCNQGFMQVRFPVAFSNLSMSWFLETDQSFAWFLALRHFMRYVLVGGHFCTMVVFVFLLLLCFYISVVCHQKNTESLLYFAHIFFISVSCLQLLFLWHIRKHFSSFCELSPMQKIIQDKKKDLAQRKEKKHDRIRRGL